MSHDSLEEDVTDAAPSHEATDQALQLIGAWSDVDWDEVATELDRIRHECPPSPPIEE